VVKVGLFANPLRSFKKHFDILVDAHAKGAPEGESEAVMKVRSNLNNKFEELVLIPWKNLTDVWNEICMRSEETKKHVDLWNHEPVKKPNLGEAVDALGKTCVSIQATLALMMENLNEFIEDYHTNSKEQSQFNDDLAVRVGMKRKKKARTEAEEDEGDVSDKEEGQIEEDHSKNASPSPSKLSAKAEASATKDRKDKRQRRN
jgi:hypothetical protein